MTYKMTIVIVKFLLLYLTMQNQLKPNNGRLFICQCIKVITLSFTN